VFIIHGAYHFWPKRVGFRNDYCLTCGQACRAVAIRTFDVGHIFWIPILPVGLWKHWRCAFCKKDPHTSPRTRRSFKWAALLVLTLFSAIFWGASVTPDEVAIDWVFRIAGPVAAGLVLWNLLRTPKESSLRQLRATVQPATDTICPFCATPLAAGPRWSCPGCDVVRY
jgi:hypothetical protein